MKNFDRQLFILAAILTLLVTSASAGQLDATWTAPTLNTDNTPLLDLSSYRVYYGTTTTVCPGPTFLTKTATSAAPGPNTTEIQHLAGLTEGQSYTIAVTALNFAGMESLCSTAVSAVPRPDAIGSSPVAWLKLDETSGTTGADSTGNGNTATLTNPVWVSGRIGNALQFDGTSSWGVIPSIPYLSRFTISAWVKGNAAPAATAATGPIHRVHNYQFGWNDPTAAFQGAVSLRINGTWRQASFGPLQGNTWYYLSATFDGATLRSFVNGQPVTATSALGDPEVETALLTIGKHATVANYWGGLVDDIRIYNRPLSQMEIQADMGTSATDTTPPPAPGPLVVGTPMLTPTGATFPISWSASIDQPSGTEVPTYLWNAAFSDGSATQTGTVGTHTLSLAMPYHSGGTASTANACVKAKDAAGNVGIEQCASFSVPAIPNPAPSPASGVIVK